MLRNREKLIVPACWNMQYNMVSATGLIVGAKVTRVDVNQRRLPRVTVSLKSFVSIFYSWLEARTIGHPLSLFLDEKRQRGNSKRMKKERCFGDT